MDTRASAQALPQGRQEYSSEDGHSSSAYEHKPFESCGPPAAAGSAQAQSTTESDCEWR